MSFFNNLKKSLGFDSDVDDELLDDTKEPETDLAQSHVRETSEEHALQSGEPIKIDSRKADMIFDRVVRTFNEALPSFLRDSVDEAAQRRILYEGLEASLKDYIASLSDEARRMCEARWSSEQETMRSEMENLRSKTKEIEQQRFDIKQQQLSSDRQKRALIDRLHDLEAQVGRLETEREQFDLENKSLVNKLKVAGVHESEIESLQESLNDAQAEISRLRAAAQLPAEPGDQDNAQQKRIAELETENAGLKKQLDEAAEKDRIATEMMNGLQSKASEARSANEQLTAKVEELGKKLAEAETYRGEVAEISAQVEKIEELLTAKDRKIEKLKETNRSLRDENTSLQQTIASSLKERAEAEETLKARIRELEADPTAPIVTADLEAATENPVEPDDNAVVKISDRDLEAIEESFDSADWLRSDPPETPSMRSGVSDAEFGYQAPVRKTPHHENDAQLSLF